MRKLTICLILAAGLIFVTSCGQKMRSLSESEGRTTGYSPVYTHGVSSRQQPYTATDPNSTKDDDSIADFTRTVTPEKSASSSDFAMGIKNAKFSDHNGTQEAKNVKVEIFWSNSSLVFVGKMDTKNPFDLISKKSKLTLRLNCVPIHRAPCGKAYIKIFADQKPNNQDPIGALEIVSAPKHLRALSENLDVSKLSPKAQALVRKYESGEAVRLDSVAVAFGIAHMTVTLPDKKVFVQSEVTATEGHLVPIDNPGSELREIGPTRMAGNSGKGQFFFIQRDTRTGIDFALNLKDPMSELNDPNSKVKNPTSDPNHKKTDGRVSPTPTPATCRLADPQKTSPRVLAVIKELLRNCDRGPVRKKRTYWQTTGRGNVERLLHIYNETKEGQENDLANRMRQALSELELAQLPALTLAMTVIESGGFNPYVRPETSSAQGEWQILFGTAKDLGLITLKPGGSWNRPQDIIDNRLDSKLSARAAAKYLNTHIAKWSYVNPVSKEWVPNMLMALASYKEGPGHTEGARQQNIQKFSDKISEEQQMLLSKDFWTLVEMGSLVEPVEYVQSVVAAFQIVANPVDFGFQKLEPVSGN